MRAKSRHLSTMDTHLWLVMRNDSVEYTVKDKGEEIFKEKEDRGIFQETRELANTCRNNMM